MNNYFNEQEKKKILAVLSNGENRTIMRYYLANATYKQIAELIGKPENFVRQKLADIWQEVCSKFLQSPKNLLYDNMDDDGKFIKICKECGAEFKTVTYGRTKCTTCLYIAQKRKDLGQNAIIEYGKNKNKKHSKPKKSLSQITAELERYNKAHGTALTYGQYILLLEKGDMANG